METLLSVPKGSPSELIFTLPIAGVSSAVASWVRPSFFPTVPKLRAIAVAPVMSAAPSVHPVIERVAGAGVVLAREPSGLKVIAIDAPPVPLGGFAVGSEAGSASPKSAVQAFAPVFVQVIWTEFGVPRESNTVIELLNVSPTAAFAGRFAEIDDFVVALALLEATSVLIAVRLAAVGSPMMLPLASVRHPCRTNPWFSRMPFLSGVKAPLRV